MDEYDAFGRKRGEDSLEELGWRREPATPTAEPSAPLDPAPLDPAPAGPPAAPTFERRPRRPRRVGVLAAFIVLSAIIGGLGLFAASVTREVRDDISGILPDAPGLVEPGDAAGSGPPPRGLQSGSLLVRRNLEPALRRLRAARLGSLNHVRLAPDRLDARLLTRGGRLRHVQVTHVGELREFSTSGPGFGHLATIPFARVDTAAPARLVRAAASRLGRPATRIDYLVLSELGGATVWGAYFKGGQVFLADRAGRITRRVS